MGTRELNGHRPKRNLVYERGVSLLNPPALGSLQCRNLPQGLDLSSVFLIFDVVFSVFEISISNYFLQIYRNTIDTW